eukprot:GDKI01034704.1.p2 GENE.GDKI01034704.1~~GDKI01034704.1.p2  ORF type:complete len:112 (-),score=37.51 GDKI01034704.1:183-518(-)
MGGSSGGAPMVGRDTVLRMRGLPFDANEHDIMNFFAGFAMAAVLPSTAPIDGRPSGEAFVEFASPEEAGRAMQTRNKANMGGRWVELYLSSKEDMMAAAAGVDPRTIRYRR